MKVRIDELEQTKEYLEEIIDLMNEQEINEVNARCNTYMMMGAFLSFPGKGYISLENLIDTLRYGDEEI